MANRDRANREILNLNMIGIINQYKIGNKYFKKTYSSIYEAAKDIFGKDASKKKCRIQAALKRENGSTGGLHFIYLSK